MTSRCVRIVLLNTRYPRYRAEQIPVPPVLWSRYTGTRGTGIELISNLPKCRVSVSNLCTELTEVSGTGVEKIRNLPKCRVHVSKNYRTDRSVGYRYRNNAEPTEVSGTGIEAAPNKYPYPRYCGRGYTDTRGTGIELLPNLSKFRVPISSWCRTLPEFSVPVRYLLTKYSRYTLVRTLPNMPLDSSP